MSPCFGTKVYLGPLTLLTSGDFYRRRLLSSLDFMSTYSSIDRCCGTLSSEHVIKRPMPPNHRLKIVPILHTLICLSAWARQYHGRRDFRDCEFVSLLGEMGFHSPRECFQCPSRSWAECTYSHRAWCHHRCRR